MAPAHHRNTSSIRDERARAFTRATLAIALATMSAGGRAAAQESTDLGTVEVTGSHIPRADGETALPVQVIRRSDIERSGAQSVEALLAQITANSGSTHEADSVGSALRPGYSSASLRGLGPRATLILLDGRRLSNYAIAPQVAGGVDLHAIPLEAIEQIEVLKDGASAIYGSDAIGGVINFILRKNFRGVTATSYHGQAEQGGSSETRETATVGYGDLKTDRYNVFAVADYQRKSGLAARDRSFAATGYRPDIGLDRTTTDSYPANVQYKGTTYNVAAPACPVSTIFVRGNCSFDTSSLVDLLPPTEKASMLARAVFQLTPDHRLIAEVTFDRSTLRSNLSPSPIGSDAVPLGLVIGLPATSPFYPRSLPVSGNLTAIRYEAVPLGERVAESVARQSRVLFGAQGQWHAWSYDTAFVFNQSRAEYRYLSGYVDSYAAARAFQTGLINPFGDSGPAGDALLQSTQITGTAQSANAISRGVDLHASRVLFDLPAGPVGLAVGAEARRDSLLDATAPFATTVVGTASNLRQAGSRSTEAAYAELEVPVAPTVDAQIAAREDHYSDFGSTLNPKIALRWQPVRGLLFRASYGRGFRAPALNELYTVQPDQQTTIADPVRCPVTKATADCSFNVAVRANGNPQLQPERSEQSSAGLVFEPDPHVSLSVDFWRIRLNDNIGLLSPTTVLANDSAYEGVNIVRGPADAAHPTLPGRIALLVLPDENLGTTRTRGIDVEIDARSDATPVGHFAARMAGTYVQSFETQLAVSDYTDVRAIYLGKRVVPRWQHYASFDWDIGAWATTVRDTFQSGYRDAKVGPDGAARHVASYNIWGAQTRYEIRKDTTLTLGADNLFNRAPPASNQTDYFQEGYNPGVSDPRGRFWYGRVALRF